MQGRTFNAGRAVRSRQDVQCKSVRSRLGRAFNAGPYVQAIFGQTIFGQSQVWPDQVWSNQPFWAKLTRICVSMF